MTSERLGVVPVFDHLREVVVCYTLDGVIRYVNPAACALLRRTTEELVGKNLWKLYPDTRTTESFAAFQRVVRTGRPERLELYSAAVGGWFETNLSRVGDDIWVMSRDITETKSATARLLVLANAGQVFAEFQGESKTAFENVARHVAELLGDLCSIRLISEDGAKFEVPVGIWACADDVRPLLEQMGDESVNDAIGRDMVEGRSVMVTRIDPREVAQRIAPAGRQALVERLAIHSIIAAPMRASGRVVGMISVCRRAGGIITPFAPDDLRTLEELAERAALIVDRINALRELERARSEMRMMVDNLPDLAWTARADGHIDFYNRRWYEYTGTTPEQMEGWGWKDVHHPDVLDSVVEKWQQSLASGDTFQMEFPLRGADGTFQWFLTRVVALRDQAGRVLRWVGTNTNIDESRRLRTELTHTAQRERLARHDAEQATRAKDEFLAAVSHELRTPLNAILGWSRILAGGSAKPEVVPRALETIERNALAQVQLVEDLLDISRIISGQLRLEVQVVELGPIIDRAIESLRPAIAARELHLQVVHDPLASTVAGDPGRLQQVIWNVVGNAVKFSHRGGRVVVTLARVDSHVEVAVSDWGAGIPPDFLPYVFDRFRQADGSSSRAYGGLGLGLAISRNLVELHGGTITASSEGKDKGATFVICLPRGAGADDRKSLLEHPTTPVDVDYRASWELDRVGVLVVDDETDTLDLIRMILELSGAVVTTASSARQALEIIEASPPEVVLCDIGMDEQDGYDFIAAARQMSAMQRVPAAALTASARATDRRRALAAGYQMHVAKPVEPAELVAVVANLVRIRRAML